VFGGDTNRRIVAFDGGDGKILWELPLNSQPGGFPMTYMAGGKQYVAIPVGQRPACERIALPVVGQGARLRSFANGPPSSRGDCGRMRSNAPNAANSARQIKHLNARLLICNEF
jgi:hypothetical protein